MDLNFYSDLSDGTGQPGDPEFLDPQPFNGFEKVTGRVHILKKSLLLIEAAFI